MLKKLKTKKNLIVFFGNMYSKIGQVGITKELSWSLGKHDEIFVNHSL